MTASLDCADPIGDGLADFVVGAASVGSKEFLQYSLLLQRGVEELIRRKPEDLEMVGFQKIISRDPDTIVRNRRPVIVMPVA